MKKTVLLLIIIFFGLRLGATEAVILLHGLTRSASSMEKMANALRDAVYYVENIDYPSRSADIKTLSSNIIGKALQDQNLEECTKINFVTHSMGGILVRQYLKNHKIEKLGRVVMLAPPNQGSEVVDNLRSWWLFKKINGPAGSELGTDSKSIPVLLGPVDFELGVIAGNWTINFINSFVMIPGSDDGKVSVDNTKVEGMKEFIIIDTSHPFIMKNDLVIDNTINFLKTGTFIAPSIVVE